MRINLNKFGRIRPYREIMPHTVYSHVTVLSIQGLKQYACNCVSNCTMCVGKQISDFCKKRADRADASRAVLYPDLTTTTAKLMEQKLFVRAASMNDGSRSRIQCYHIGTYVLLICSVTLQSGAAVPW